MSNVSIRQALEGKLNAIEKLPTAWENKDFTKPSGPYQEVYILFAKPENPTMGDNHYRQRGVFQVTLRYPPLTGPLDAQLRAELLRETFKRGLSLSVNSVTTHIDETPEIGEGRNIEDRYVIVVRIRFYADIFKEA
jgi:hypothetical protein